MFLKQRLEFLSFINVGYFVLRIKPDFSRRLVYDFLVFSFDTGARYRVVVFRVLSVVHDFNVVRATQVVISKGTSHILNNFLSLFFKSIAMFDSGAFFVILLGFLAYNRSQDCYTKMSLVRPPRPVGPRPCPSSIPGHRPCPPPVTPRVRPPRPVGPRPCPPPLSHHGSFPTPVSSCTLPTFRHFSSSALTSSPAVRSSAAPWALVMRCQTRAFPRVEFFAV
jgi:hypothetical protein